MRNLYTCQSSGIFLIFSLIIMAAGRSTSNVTVVLGGQWGDEGKGKLVDMLATKADYVCRCQVFNNLALFLNCVV